LTEIVSAILSFLPIILAIIVSYIATNFAVGYLAMKEMIAQLATVISALDEAMDEITEAMDDDDYTEDEFREIFAKMQVVFAEARKLIRIIAQSSLWGIFTGIFHPEYRAAAAQRIPFLKKQ